jgi:hypothetical protein
VIAITAAVVALAGVTVLTMFALVVVAVRREDHATRLPVEAPGPMTAAVRRLAGLHVHRATARASATRDGEPAHRLPRTR